MTTKERLLSLFESNKGVYISGEDLASKLDLSRTAIWKAINSLRKDGYVIDAVQNKGYSLAIDTDILSTQGIEKYLQDCPEKLTIEVYEQVSSTNTMVRERAVVGAQEGLVIIASEQVAGRGRRGRSFYSPNNSGIYLSMLLRPRNMDLAQAASITTIAAVAAVEAIREIANQNAGIKWVNDIFINDRKVSGILTEAAMDLESTGLDYVVLGIGLNAYEPEGGFPEEIRDIAGAIFDRATNDGKNALSAAFIKNFMKYYKADNPKDYVDKYKEYSIVLGKNVNVINKDGSCRAKVLDIDSECHLIVEYENGQRDVLSSGEISIKL